MRAFDGAARREFRVRSFPRTRRNIGVSVGIIGGLVLLILAALWFRVEVEIGAVLLGAVLALAAAHLSALWLCARTRR